MKAYVYIYDTCTFYEIILTAYFLKAAGVSVFFCGHSAGEVTVWEGFTVRPDMNIRDIPVEEADALILPGGLPEHADRDALFPVIRAFYDRGLVIGAICSGVLLLEEAGIPDQINTTLSTGKDCVRHQNIVSAEPNAYVDFALEVGRSLEIFEDEADFQETVDFFKYFKKPRA